MEETRILTWAVGFHFILYGPTPFIPHLNYVAQLNLTDGKKSVVYNSSVRE